MFIDEVKIWVRAGRGGNGLVSFRRESKGRKFGKPDGGNGGKGGDIIIKCSARLRTLADFKRLKKFKAEDGKGGMENKKTGKDGNDLILEVPCGTIVYELIKSEIRNPKSEANSKFKIQSLKHNISKFPPNKKDTTQRKRIADLKNPDESIIICKGGKDGFGNAHFCTATVRAPERRTLGKAGMEKKLFLEIKLLADIGLIGLPNSGKSTLLSRISKARPKIAAYPFTTMEPNLGVIRVYNKNFVVADIPGLIEGAYKGKGLGDKFLRHIERCQKLIHLIDVTNDDVVRDYKTIRDELGQFANKLLNKEEIVVLNKIDLISSGKLKIESGKLKKRLKINAISISAVTGEGVDKLHSLLAN